MSYTRSLSVGLGLVGVLFTLVSNWFRTHSPRTLSPGQFLVFRALAADAAYAFGASAFISFLFPRAPLWVVVGVPLFGVMYRLSRIRPAFQPFIDKTPFGAGITWVEQELQSRSPLLHNQPGQLRIAHLSDLHLSATVTMEGELPGHVTEDAFSAALRWALEQDPDLVLLSGDITDSGEPAEWQTFQRVLGSLEPRDLEKIALVPGNHDLTTLRTLGTRAIDCGYQFAAEERAAYLYVSNILSLNAEKIRAITSRGEHSLASIQSAISSFVQVYNAHLPRLQRDDEWWNPLTPLRQRSLGVPSHITALIPHFLIAPELVTAARSGQAGDFWPSPERFLFRDLLRELYPMVLYEGPHHVVFGLNSCLYDVSNMNSSGFGRLGKTQLARLRKALQATEGKRLVVALHHHLEVPASVPLPTRAKVIDTIALGDATQLIKAVGDQPALLLHGHKHIGYHASGSGLTVLSAGSVAYGDVIRRERAACYVYDVPAQGAVTVVGKRLPSSDWSS